MAEAWLNHFGGEQFEAESAGLSPGTLNPLVVKVMQEVGIDISHRKTRAVFDLFQADQLFAYVITVCDETSAEKCPVFPGITKRFHWSFLDPAALTGTEAKKIAKTREIRDLIKVKIANWCQEMGIPPS
jgi:arsenate reductase